MKFELEQTLGLSLGLSFKHAPSHLTCTSIFHSIFVCLLHRTKLSSLAARTRSAYGTISNCRAITNPLATDNLVRNVSTSVLVEKHRLLTVHKFRMVASKGKPATEWIGDFPLPDAGNDQPHSVSTVYSPWSLASCLSSRKSRNENYHFLW